MQPSRHHFGGRWERLVYGVGRQQHRPCYSERSHHRISDSGPLEPSTRDRGGSRRRDLVRGVRRQQGRTLRSGNGLIRVSHSGSAYVPVVHRCRFGRESVVYRLPKSSWKDLDLRFDDHFSGRAQLVGYSRRDHERSRWRSMVRRLIPECHRAPYDERELYRVSDSNRRARLGRLLPDRIGLSGLLRVKATRSVESRYRGR